jgi:hypothetical protein
MPIPGWSYVKGKLIKEGVRAGAKALGADDETAKNIGRIVGVGAGVIGGLVTLDFLGVGATLAGEVAEEVVEEAAEEAFEETFSEASFGAVDEVMHHVTRTEPTFGRATEAMLNAHSVADISFSTLSMQANNLLPELPTQAQNILSEAIKSGNGATLQNALDKVIQMIPDGNGELIRKVSKVMQTVIKFRGN